MSTLLKRADPAVLPVGAGSLTFRVASSLDRDVARETAAAWLSRIIAGGELAADFGIGPLSIAEIAERIARGERDQDATVMTLYAVALALRVEPVIDGLTRLGPDGAERPIEPTRADIGYLFEEPAVMSTFLEKATGDVFALSTAGNGSAPGSSTNSGAEN